MRNITKQFFELIQNSKYTVFFGGAGVSTESGIPDFRSENGLYSSKNEKFSEHPPEYYLSRDCLIKNPKEFYRYYREMSFAKEFEPNITHNVLAKLEKLGKLQSIITQNIDGLHQKAGSKNVIEIHGNAKSCKCNTCGILYSSGYIKENKNEIPTCKYCGGYVRPDITLYGEILPQEAILKANIEIKKANLLIIGGTSLSVHPASSLIKFFKGERIVIINNSLLDIPTLPNTIFIQSSLGKFFGEIDKLL